ncbi:MAG: 2-phosphosulfolactate phosphatase [Bacteroidia bacterium]|nr:2-phosphosulfolactate phosphatase [Bacteroidia bacterium]
MSKKLEVVLTPALAGQFGFEDKAVVIIDVLRATSTIAIALDKGFKQVLTSKEVDKALSLKDADSLVAGERNGDKVQGADVGNSPVEIQNLTSIKEKFVLTSTNGTKCVEKAVLQNAKVVLCGALVNVQALADFLNQSQFDIVLFCAGWKDNENIEDTYMAGSLIDKLQDVSLQNDAAFIAQTVYQSNKHLANQFLGSANHYQRLKNKGNHADLALCIQESISESVPCLQSFDEGVAVFTKI